MKTFFRNLRHRLAHKMGWYLGTVDTWYEGEILMVGFRCAECGELAGVEPVPNHIVNVI